MIHVRAAAEKNTKNAVGQTNPHSIFSFKINPTAKKHKIQAHPVLQKHP